MSYTSMGAGSPAKSFHSRKGAESVVSGMMSDALSDYARKASELSLESGEEGDERLDLPGSWVPRLDVDFDSYELRFPGGQKMLLYKNCRVVCFVPFIWPRFCHPSHVKACTPFCEFVPVKSTSWLCTQEMKTGGAQ